jgi:hypothetical protein
MAAVTKGCRTVDDCTGTSTRVFGIDLWAMIRRACGKNPCQGVGKPPTHEQSVRRTRRKSKQATVYIQPLATISEDPRLWQLACLLLAHTDLRET